MAEIVNELAQLRADTVKFTEVGKELREEAFEQRRFAAQQTIALQELLRQAADARRYIN